MPHTQVTSPPSNHYTVLAHQDVLLDNLHGHLGILNVPYRVVSDLDRLLACGGLGDLQRGKAVGGFVCSIIPHDVRYQNGVLVVPLLAVSDLEQPFLTVGDLTDLGYGGGVGGLLCNICPLLSCNYFCMGFLSSSPTPSSFPADLIRSNVRSSL